MATGAVVSIILNEIDPFAGAWLRGLIDAGEIPAGTIDTRSITEVRGSELEGYQQCHTISSRESGAGRSHCDSPDGATVKCGRVQRPVNRSPQPVKVAAKKTSGTCGPIVERLGELGVDSAVAKRIVRLAKSNRVGGLRGYGNAIVPQVAAEFIRAYMKTRKEK